MENKTTDLLISRVDTNPANGTGNPYQRYPERATWRVIETFERPDNTRYVRTWECHRWGGTCAPPILVSTVEVERAA